MENYFYLCCTLWVLILFKRIIELGIEQKDNKKATHKSGQIFEIK
jgi:hypothetical protein